jgi:hypothetical protein
VSLQIDGKLPCGQGKYYFKSEEGKMGQSYCAVVMMACADRFRMSTAYLMTTPLPGRPDYVESLFNNRTGKPMRLYGEESTSLLKDFVEPAHRQRHIGHSYC